MSLDSGGEDAVTVGEGVKKNPGLARRLGGSYFLQIRS